MNGDRGSPAAFWSQGAKFLIGLFAGLCATFVPRIVTALSNSDPTGEIELFGADYITLAIVFSVFLGFGVMIIKWSAVCDPPEVFGAALGIPALVAGAFNMSASVDAVEQQTGDVVQLAAELQTLSGIDTLEPDTIILPGPQSSVLAPERTFGFRLISPAFAQTTQQAETKFTPGSVLELRQYYVVLGKYPSLEEAQNALPALKQIAPNAVAVGGSRGAYVLNGLQPKPLPQATIDASQLKKTLPQDGQVNLLPAR